jgi:3-oxoacyl-[acyl-carrier-protein] synthase III
MLNVKILAMGKALPANVVSSEMLDVTLGKKGGYTFKKSGIISRQFSPYEQSQSELAAIALKDALANAAIQAGTIDLLISACGVQEQALPSTACAIAEHAGLSEGTPAFDVNSSCLSFLTALNVAASLLATGSYKRIAVVSSDQPSRGINWEDPEASLIFGDGAAAAIVERGSVTQGIRSFMFKTYTVGRRFCEIRAGGTKRNPIVGSEHHDYMFSMNGKLVLKLALQQMPGFLDELFAQSKTSQDSVDVIIPHQASHLGMSHMIKRIGLDEKNVINIYKTHGNQVAASLPTALYEAFATGRLSSGKRGLLLGTAAGISIGGLVLDV